MTKCYTFYSYKGGSGRTTTAVNTVRHLRDQFDPKQNRILLVDADLESAGLTYFFGLHKRISSKFNETAHTTKVLSTYNDDDIARMFSEGLSDMRTIIGKTQERIASLYGKDKVAYFADIPLSSNERTVFNIILEVIETNNTTRMDIFRNYDPNNWLINKLKEIQKSTLSNEQKIAAKRKAMLDFLPPLSFVDVSSFFDLPAGSVDFLGASVDTNDAQIARNDANYRINALIKECNKHGYGAVIFDCGAGTQSTAHVLHQVSDVLVYCMRPTTQFVEGTRNNIDRYYKALNESIELKKETGRKSDAGKAVVLLPTAVAKPNVKDALNPIYDQCFANLKSLLSNEVLQLVDDTFCTPAKALGEVQLFKWREMILGTKVTGENDAVTKALADYAEEKTMPKDAQDAYATYRLLAKRLIANS